MDGFKTLPKMQAFKEGGHAKPKAMCYGGSSSKKMKEGGAACADDMAQDKKMIKKAFKQHDKAEHDKSEPTEIKLKKGGRSKKECGTVKKYKTGGSVGVYGVKKTAQDIKNIEAAKKEKPKMIAKGGSVADENKKPSGDAVKMIKSKESAKKATAPSKASTKPNFKGSDVSKTNKMPAGEKDKIKKVAPTGDKKAAAKSGAKEMPNKYKTGGKVKKYADGKSVKQAGATEAQQKYYDKNMAEGDKKTAKADYEAFGSRGDAAKKGMEEGRMNAMGDTYKKGGKTKKMKCMADGGLTAEQLKYLGGADQTDPFIMARMYEATGTKPASAMSGYQGDIADMDTPYGNPSQQDVNGGGMPSEQDMNGGSYNGKQAYPTAPAPMRRRAAQPSFMQRVGKAFSNLGSSYSNQPGIYKKGGTINMNEGGSLKEVDAQENPGLAKLPTDVRNKMGYMKAGKKVC